MKEMSEKLKDLIESIRNNTCPTSIDLSFKEIGDAGAQALAKALETNHTLTSMNLSCNEIGAAGAQALAKALERNSTLIDLNLHKNRIGATGAQALANALQTNRTLTRLNLYTNEMGDAGAQALANALETNSTLTSLYLDFNQIRDAGAQALANALEKNSTLTRLDFDFNLISAAGAQALDKSIADNNMFQEILRQAEQQFVPKKRRPTATPTTKSVSSSSSSSSSGSSVDAQDVKGQIEIVDSQETLESDEQRYDRLLALFLSLKKRLNDLNNGSNVSKINHTLAKVTLAFASLDDLYTPHKPNTKHTTTRIAILEPLCLLPLEEGLKQKVLSTLAHVYYQSKDYISAFTCAKHLDASYEHRNELISTAFAQAIGIKGIGETPLDFKQLYSHVANTENLKDKLTELEKGYKTKCKELELTPFDSLGSKDNDEKKAQEGSNIAAAPAPSPSEIALSNSAPILAIFTSNPQLVAAAQPPAAAAPPESPVVHNSEDPEEKFSPGKK